MSVEQIEGFEIFDQINKENPIYSRLLPRNMVKVSLVRDWVLNSSEKRMPLEDKSKKEEIKIAKIWSCIREYFLKPLNSFKNSEDREKFVKMVMELNTDISSEQFQDILIIIFELEAFENSHQIEENNTSQYCSKEAKSQMSIRERLQIPESIIVEDDDENPTISIVKSIQNWRKEHGNPVVLRAIGYDVPMDEKVIAKICIEIKNGIIQKYKEIRTDKDREAFIEYLKKSYRLRFEQFEEILKVIDAIEIKRREDVPIYLENARLIAKWKEENGRKPGYSNSASEEEKAFAPLFSL